MVDISGRCEPGFEAVKDAFAPNFEQNGDVGASCAVALHGELVVDLWGGTLDVEGTTPWDEDTIINVFSTTKTMSCLSLLVLASRGLVDVDAPVARYWPEFEQNGKDGVLVRHLLSHTAGAPGLGPAPRRHRPLRLGQGDRAAGRAGAVVGAGLEVRLPRHHPGQPGRRGRAPRRRPLGRALLRRGDRQAARRRLPHRHRRPSATTGSPPSSPPRRSSSAARAPTAAAPTRTSIPYRAVEPAPGGRGLLDDPVAPGRDPRRRRPRQRPQRGAGPVRGVGRRVGPRRRPAHARHRRAHLRRPGGRSRPGPGHRRDVRRRLRAQLAPGADRARTRGSATGAAGAARWSSTTSTPASRWAT